MQINPKNPRWWNWLDFKSKLYRLFYNSEGKRRHSLILALGFFTLLSLFAFANFTAGVLAQRNYAVSNMLFKPLILDNYDILVRQISQYLRILKL